MSTKPQRNCIVRSWIRLLGWGNIIEQSWNKISLWHFFVLIHSQFCDAARFKIYHYVAHPSIANICNAACSVCVFVYQFCQIFKEGGGDWGEGEWWCMGPSLPLACFIFEGKGSNFKGSLVLLGDPWWHLLAVSRLLPLSISQETGNGQTLLKIILDIYIYF